MNSRRQEQQLVADQAAEWMLRLKTEGPQAHAVLLRWLKESPLHVQEFLLASGVDDALRNLDPERRVSVEALIARAHAKSKVIPLKTRRFPTRRTETRPLRRWLPSLAANVAAFAMIAFAGWHFYFKQGNDGVYITELGAQRTFRLTDGSVVQLNTQSEVEVHYTETTRNVYLNQGQALFQVSPDATRPFRVHAADTVIQAIGTQFDVRRYADRTTVAVVEGTVELLPRTEALQPVKVTVGEKATVEEDGKIELTQRINTEAATAWRHQRVVFIDTPLREIANEFNRYNASPQMRIEGNTLENMAFSGSFNAFSPQSFLAYISQETDLATEQRGDEVVIRQH